MPIVHDEPRVVNCLDALASAKCLDVQFLIDIGIEEIPGDGLRIPYFDEGGELLFTRERDRPRGPRFRQPSGVKLSPYGLWKLDAARRVGSLFITEGESDAWALWTTEMPVLGLPGASSAKCLEQDHIESLSDLFIVPDNDDAGEQLVESVVKRLHAIGYAGRLWRVRVPKQFKDVSDWRVSDVPGFPDALASAIESRERIDKQHEGKTATDDINDLLTDLANARRLCAAYGERFRHIFAWRKWLHWTGKHWQQDADAEIVRCAKATAVSMFEAAKRDIASINL